MTWIERIPRWLRRTLAALWIIGATSLLIWISDLNDHGIACEDDDAPSGYCEQLHLEQQK